jgi:HAMP domain-containing protein
MIELAKKSGSGFIEYQWARTPDTPPVDKRTYVKLFEPWGWVVGTGVYIDDLRAAAQHSLIETGVMALIVALVVSGVAFLIARTITNPIARLTQVMGKVADGQFDTEVLGANRTDEIGAMARAVEVFRENGLKVAQMTEAEAARIIARPGRPQPDDGRAAERLRHRGRCRGRGRFLPPRGHRIPRSRAQRHCRQRSTASSRPSTVAWVKPAPCSADMAEQRLTSRVTGTYAGAFGKLKDDTNAVADRLTDIVGQLRQTSGGVKRPRRNPCGRQRPFRAHHAPGRHHRGNLRLDGAAGRHGEQNAKSARESSGHPGPCGVPSGRRGRRGDEDQPTAPWSGFRPARPRSPTSSGSSTTSPSRPTCSRSTPRWKRHAPARPARALPWSPSKCGAWRSRRPAPPPTSRR